MGDDPQPEELAVVVGQSGKGEPDRVRLVVGDQPIGRLCSNCLVHHRHGAQTSAGAFEVDAASTPAGDVSERCCKERFADPDGAEDHGIVGCFNEVD